MNSDSFLYWVISFGLPLTFATIGAIIGICVTEKLNLMLSFIVYWIITLFFMFIGIEITSLIVDGYVLS